MVYSCLVHHYYDAHCRGEFALGGGQYTGTETGLSDLTGQEQIHLFDARVHWISCPRWTGTAALQRGSILAARFKSLGTGTPVVCGCLPDGAAWFYLRRTEVCVAARISIQYQCRGGSYHLGQPRPDRVVEHL